MKIAVNTRWLLHQKLEGIGNFTHHLLSRVVANHPEVEFHFFFDRTFHNSYIYGNNVTPHLLQPPARRPLLWNIWNNFAVKQKLKKLKPDLYFSPDGFIPTSTKVKTLNTVHDLNFEHHPEWIPNFAIKYYKKYFRLGAENASQLITVSEYSKTDLHNLYGIPLQNIEVVHNGAGNFAVADDQDIANFKNQNTAGDPYFIFVGALNPRKNLQGIFAAFDKLESSHKLVVVGDKMHWSKEIEAAFASMENQEKVTFTGRLEGEALNTAYSGATALLFPSLFEGFGIPILEAFQSGTAVITANNSSMPEVAGDAALLVDAENTDSILHAMQKLINKKGLRDDLIIKGKLQSQKFSWDASAEKLWQIMLKTIEA